MCCIAIRPYARLPATAIAELIPFGYSLRNSFDELSFENPGVVISVSALSSNASEQLNPRAIVTKLGYLNSGLKSRRFFPGNGFIMPDNKQSGCHNLR